MHEGSCHCGAVRLRIPRVPERLDNCNCSICWRYGALWAYFASEPDSETVTITARPDALQEYSWGFKGLRFFRCRHCGVVTHSQNAEGQEPSIAGINMRNFDLQTLATARVVAVDGRSRSRSRAHFNA